MKHVDDREVGSTLTEAQVQIVCRFIEECPELRDDQVAAWSAMHPDLAGEFEETAEILNGEREAIELEGAEPGREDGDDDADALADRFFAAWAPRVLIGAQP